MSPSCLLLLHGALGTREQFDALAPLLAPHFTVHALDFEGHGATPARGRDFRSERFAETVIEFLDERGIERATSLAIAWAATSPASSRGWSRSAWRASRRWARASPGTRRPSAASCAFWTRRPCAKKCRASSRSLPRATPRWAGKRSWSRHRSCSGPTARAAASPPRSPRRSPNPCASSSATATRRRAVAESLAFYQALPQGQFEVLPATPHPLPRAPLERLAASLVEFFGETRRV